MKDKMYFENIADVFLFGKHKGESLWRVLHKNQSYVYWCVNNIADFVVSHNTLSQIKEFFPEFIIPQNFSAHVLDLSDTDHDCEYDCCREYEDKPEYGRYAGSYAQDVMGYSDEYIDTIFDGDPLAYWNID